MNMFIYSLSDFVIHLRAFHNLELFHYLLPQSKVLILKQDDDISFELVQSTLPQQQ